MRSIQRVGAATLFLRGTLGSPRNDASPARRVAPFSSPVPRPNAAPAPARVPHRRGRAFTVAASAREMGPPAGRGEGARAGGLAGIDESDPRRPRGPNARAPPPGATSDAAMPAGGTAAMTHSDDDDDDGATSGTPALAVERLLALEREGLKFHQMRERCRAILAAPGVHVPSFAADALDILAKRSRGGRTSSSSTVDPVAHLIMECVPRVTAHIRERHDFPMMDDTSVRERFADSRDRSPGVRLILEALADFDDDCNDGDGGSTNRLLVTDRARLDPRTLLRVAETYGVSLEDLTDAGGEDAARSLETYARSLIHREGKHAPGVNLALWFSLDAFANEETVDELTRAGAFGLASDVAACVAGDGLKRRCVEACLELGDSGDHAGLRAAHAAAERFRLGTVFPTAKTRYFESTIKRMVAKGQAEAALRHAGDDEHLQRCVIASLVASGDASTAAEYVARLAPDFAGSGGDFDKMCGLLGTETELAAAQAARREAHVQLPEDMSENGGVVWVDDEDGLRAACDALLAADVVGIDTEWAADPDAERAAAERNRRRKGTRWARKRWRDQKKLAKKLAAEAEALEASNGESDVDDCSSGDASSGDASSGEGERTGAGAGAEDEDAAERRAASVVALLQVATRDRVFLVDLPALLRACPDAIAPTLGAVLADRSVLKTGFGVAEDLRRLARLHPPAFGAERLGGPRGGVGPVIDLQHVWAAGTRIAREEAAAGGRAKRGRRARAAAAAAAAEGVHGVGGGGVDASPPKRLVGPWSLKEHYQRKHLVGLSHLTAAVLGKPLDKATRMSDWSKRPLTSRQVTYAALDAWVLVELMRTLRENHAEELERLAGGLTHVRE